MTFRVSRFFIAVFAVAGMSDGASSMSLKEAVERAVTTNPRVLEAAANRRSIDHELEQAYGAFLPKLDLDTSFGTQVIDRPNSLSDENNRTWRLARDATAVARHTFFDGFARSNEVYRQAARIDGAAARVLERAELVALDAIESYLDVVRHERILAAADRNVGVHRELLSLVRSRVRGGSSTEGELHQAEERVAAVEAVRADVLRDLGAARARFENVVGAPPSRLAGTRPPRGLPKTQAMAIAMARNNNPALQAGTSDVEAADAEFDKSTGLFLPKVGVEGRASVGEDLDGTPGRNNEFAVKMTMTWNLFNGGADVGRRRQLGEKVTESKLRLDQLRRTVDETVRRSWSDIGSNDVRLRALRKQTVAADGVIANYNKEYEAGLRDLLDLLIAQNSAFNARLQLISSESISVFARYRLLASVGGLLDNFGIAAPAGSEIGAPEGLNLFVGAPLIEPLRKW